MEKTENRANFGSRLGIILATAGSAVGLGNVWRFPYMTGQNGGAVFIIIYIACVLLLGIPCMVSEFIIGRRAQANTARAYTSLAGGTAWRWVGYLGVLTGFLITGYYAVVSGWCLEYIYASLMGHLKGDAGFVEAYFQQFSQNPWKPLVWMLLFFGITHWVIVRGVEKGIERASKILMPTLFVLLLIIVGASCSLPGAAGGIDYLLRPDFTKLTRDVFLGALGQAFYSLSIAMGCLCTYASYFRRDTNLTKSAVQISLIDCMVAILAGLMIFPAAFSVGVNPGSGASLVFITLPNVFNQAFAAVPLLGSVVALLFYALLSLAALTSLMSLHEVSTAFLHEELNISRRRGATIVTLTCAVIGTFCSLSLGGYDALQLFGRSLFDLFDFVTGQVFLPVGGFLTCLFLGWYVPRNIVHEEFTNGGTVSRQLFGYFLFSVRYVCPLLILLIFLHQFGVV
ncbi:MAG: sodium-dependent transporter [Prevotella sp.]|nr:sodium-dependent transporter [Prevotella sp.]